MVYRVLIFETGLSRSLGQPSSYIVTDQPPGWNDNEERWPWAAEFKVSQRHDNETQKRRAREYCEYMNKGIVVQLPFRGQNGG